MKHLLLAMLLIFGSSSLMADIIIKQPSGGKHQPSGKRHLPHHGGAKGYFPS